ncbi:MAG: diguanylate cyclase [Nitrospirota bacterium]
MRYDDLVTSIQQLGKDPARLIYEDELTGLPNRRFLLACFEHRIRWEELDATPVSLLMLDVDFFKKINDTHGHDAGDRALVHVAQQLKAVAGEQWTPIRYAGDEFMILLPNGRNDEAVALGERLLARMQAEPLRLDGGAELRLTVSIGAATAPTDARTGRTLIHQADTALYQAKRSGRNRVARATDAQQAAPSPKAVLQQLGGGALCDREAALAAVQSVIQRFDQGQSQFVLVEGGVGMGKTAFLQAVRRQLQGLDTYLVRAAGPLQDNYRPYALATTILVALLGQRDDKGQAAFGSLTKEEIAYLGALLPPLQGQPELRLAPDEASRREGIFRAALRFLFLLLDYRPLVLLIDDLHNADEASLALLRRLLTQEEVPVLLCGAAAVPMKSPAEGTKAPLETFVEAHGAELKLAKVPLARLTADGIVAYLRTLFPQLAAPPDAAGTLARVTQGSPLFLAQLLRKLVMDHTIKPVDRRWVIESLDEDKLPKSLDEIVRQQIGTLGNDQRALLEHTSVFGEHVSLSVLTGGAEAEEAKVLELVEQAETLGLLSAEYQVNDETVRFVGKQVLDVAYNDIGEARRRALHDRVGEYQEALFQQGFLPSAAPLAYHFTRSANSDKAAAYQRVVAAESAPLFNAKEASAYHTEAVTSTDTPLDPVSLAYVPDVVRSFQTAVRNLKLYPPSSQQVVNPCRDFVKTVQQVLKKNARLNIVETKRSLLVNGQRVNDVGEYRFVAGPFRAFLDSVFLRGFAFMQGVTDEELTRMLGGVARTKPEQIDESYWSRFTAEQGMPGIHLKQTGWHAQRLAEQAGSAPAETQTPGKRELQA